MSDERLKKVNMKAPYTDQNPYEIDINYLILIIVLIVLGADVISLDSFLRL
jgi:hypothetical protein